MKLLCAWCEKEGKPALIAEVEPKDDPIPTHRMCLKHRAEAGEELEALREKVEEVRGKVARRESESARRRGRGGRPMQEAMKEAVRLWLRAARIPSVVALLEAVKAELATRNIVLEFAVTHRIPERGSKT